MNAQYCIAKEEFYYGCKENVDFVLVSQSNDPRYFDTPVDARAEINDREDEIYMLSHNEYARPEYHIVDAQTAEYILSGRNMDLSNFDWGQAICDCGECETCLDMMAAQDLELVIDKSWRVK